MAESVTLENNTTETVVDDVNVTVAVADAPVADAPVADAPVADAPVADAPVADAPVANPKSTGKSVGFLIDIESKALIETFSDLEDFGVDKIMSILPKLMQHVENYKNLRGVQKRELIISMLKHIIDITDGPGNDAIWDPILKQLVPSLIDTLIEVDSGRLKLRKKPGFLGRLFCCKPKKVEG